ncbi:MAG: hypothetical protein AB3N16_02725, partial [Flavobacteriaceae bacterium]
MLGLNRGFPYGEALLFLFLIVICPSATLLGQDTSYLDYLPTCNDSDLRQNRNFLEGTMEAPSLVKRIDSLGIVYCDAVANGDYKLQAGSLIGMANVYKFHVAHPEAMKVIFACSSKALEVSRKGGLVEEQFTVLERLSTAFTSNAFYGPALEYGQQFLDLSKKERDTVRMGEAYMLMGRTLREQRKFMESEHMLHRALELQTGSKNSKRNTAYA